MIKQGKNHVGKTTASSREIRALRAEIENRQSSAINQVDRAVALADRETGLGGWGSGAGSPVPDPQLLVGNMGRPASEGERGTPGAAGDAGLMAGLLPAPDGGAAPPGSSAAGVPYRFDGTVGISGTPITSGFLLDLGEYNAELMGRNAVPIYEKMRRSDAQVRATLTACKLPVLSAKWEIMPATPSSPAPVPQKGEGRSTNKVSSVGAGKQTGAKSKEVAEFIKENLLGGLEFQGSTGGWVSQSWQAVIANALLMLDFGCAVHEDVWTVDGDRIRLRSLPSRLPITFYRWHTEADGETLLALEQYGYRRGRFLNVILPSDKMARFTYQQEGANFWGISLQRAMYPHWYIKTKLYRIDAIANERNALGIPVFRLAPGFASEDKAAAYSFVTQLAAHEATGLVEPPGDQNTGFRIAGYEGELRDPMPSIQHHNEMISRAALNTFMDLGQSAHGSRALGVTATDFFLLGLQSVADQIAADITSTTIRRLVRLNFGDCAPRPRLVAGNVQARSVSAMVADLAALAQQGLVVSDRNIRRVIREKFALPEESREGIVATRGESIDTGEVNEISGRGAGEIKAVTSDE
jgi:hypothetical protein